MTLGCRLVLAASLSAAGGALAVAETPASEQQAAAPRDRAAASVPGGVVRGRVTAAATGQPLHRVRITLNGPAQNSPTTVTDTRGAFELTDVPPGTYTMTAVRAGYLTIQYGQRRPREAGRPFEIQSGQLLERVEIALFRGGVLAGRITDELGDAAPGVRVEAIELRYVRGRRVAVAAKIVTTNDAGEYRLSGLEPGPYQIRASTREAWEGDDGRETFVYAITFFPGVVGIDQARSLTVGVGQEVSALDFGLVAGRAARIAGTVEDARGEPLAGQVVSLSEISRTIGGRLLSSGSGGTTRSDARGAFEFARLAPGEYNVYSGVQTERAIASVIVTDGEVRHLVLSPRKPTAVAGTVVTDDGTTPPFLATRLRVDPIDVDPELVLGAWAAPREQTLGRDWTFRFTNMDGRFLFRVNGLPDDWMLKSAVLGGRDVTDAPLLVVRGGADVGGLQIVLSRTGAKVTGEVVDRTGTPAVDATVILFAESPAQWGPGSRFIRAARPDDRGRFSIGGVPPGVYRAIAKALVVDGQWEDVEFLQSLFRDAGRLELRESASASIRLTLLEAR